MRILFEFDYKNYDENGTVGYRPSVRGIIRKDGKYAFVYSSKYDYYTFSGGGIEQNETRSLALIREIREELGLEIKPDTIEEYGAIIRKEKGMIDEIFVQENYYYTCEVFDTVVHEQKLENYEADEGFKLAWITIEEALDVNLNHNHGEYDDKEWFNNLINREATLMQRLKEEE